MGYANIKPIKSISKVLVYFNNTVFNYFKSTVLFHFPKKANLEVDKDEYTNA